MFVLLVKPGDNEHEHGTNTRLEETEEETLSIKTLVVGTSCGTQQASAPDEYYDESDAFDGKSLSEDDGRSGTDDETEIEDGRGEGVSVADG